MSDQTNHEYYRQRLETERALEASADNEAAAKLHRELAELYAGLLSDLDRPIRSNLRITNG